MAILQVALDFVDLHRCPAAIFVIFKAAITERILRFDCINSKLTNHGNLLAGGKGMPAVV